MRDLRRDGALLLPDAFEPEAVSKRGFAGDRNGDHVAELSAAVWGRGVCQVVQKYNVTPYAAAARPEDRATTPGRDAGHTE